MQYYCRYGGLIAVTYGQFLYAVSFCTIKYKHHKELMSKVPELVKKTKKKTLY